MWLAEDRGRCERGKDVLVMSYPGRYLGSGSLSNVD